MLTKVTIIQYNNSQKASTSINVILLRTKLYTYIQHITLMSHSSIAIIWGTGFLPPAPLTYIYLFLDLHVFLNLFTRTAVLLKYTNY